MVTILTLTFGGDFLTLEEQPVSRLFSSLAWHGDSSYRAILPSSKDSDHSLFKLSIHLPSKQGYFLRGRFTKTENHIREVTRYNLRSSCQSQKLWETHEIGFSRLKIEEAPPPPNKFSMLFPLFLLCHFFNWFRIKFPNGEAREISSNRLLVGLLEVEANAWGHGPS